MLHKALDARQQSRVTLQLGNVDNVRIECLKEIVIGLQLPQLPDTVQSPPGPPRDEYEIFLTDVLTGPMNLTKTVRKFQVKERFMHGHRLYLASLHVVIPFHFRCQTCEFPCFCEEFVIPRKVLPYVFLRLR